MKLDKIIDVQKIGRFEKLSVPTSLRFSKVTLIFGENGWGKSTLAEIFRSVATKDARILLGRETLAAAGEQKAILLVDGNQARFDGAAWTGPCPKIAVYDQVFINQNVFSGDFVSHDHLKKQYGLVVGESGVALMQQIIALDEEVKTVNTTTKRCERALQSAITTLGLSTLPVDAFIALEQLEHADEAIADKQRAVARAERADQITSAALPEDLPKPTGVADFRSVLGASIEGIAAEAHQRLRDHIARYQTKNGAPLSHEAWLEAGLAFSPDDACPYCGQDVRDNALIDTYKGFFSEAYKAHAGNVKRARATLKRHIDGEFVRTIDASIRNFGTIAANWKTLANIDLPSLPAHDAPLGELRRAAAEIDGLLEAKQADLVAAIPENSVEAALAPWRVACEALARITKEIERYRERLLEIRRGQAAVRLAELRQELATLRARKRRYEPDVVGDIDELLTARARKKAIEDDKKDKRDQLTAFTKAVTEGLGDTINAYLDRLGAGFRIDYQQPNYRGNEPSAAYNILINNVPVPPRVAQDDPSQPSFKNTLSAGDKSVLALALFLATLRTRADLSEMIVVFDDPFTSMDEFRRTFTVNEINKLIPHAAQIIVLSHEKNFLRLCWDTLDQSLITSVSIQTGAPGVASLGLFDLEKATRPRDVTERMEVQEFCELSKGEAGQIRTLLRKVLEGFYRQGDPELFAQDELLDGIIRKLKDAPAEHPYKGAVESLEEINRYTRNFHHAPVEGSVSEDTNVEELRTYCRRVIGLTRGAA